VLDGFIRDCLPEHLGSNRCRALTHGAQLGARRVGGHVPESAVWIDHHPIRRKHAQRLMYARHDLL
jgi:hypothetical protein